MLHSELRVGMKVRANERSNGKYLITKASQNCEGIVKRIYEDEFELEVTSHEFSHKIGNAYGVEAEYFDKVEEVPATLKVELKEKEQELKLGDLVVTDGGNHVLIFKHGTGFRGVILNQERVTTVERSLETLKRAIVRSLGKIERIVPSTKLQITEI